MPSQPVGLQESILFGEGFELDLRPRRLRRGSRVLKVERIPLEILLLLLEHPGEIVTREEIVARIWGADVFLDTDNGIRGAIRKIRQVLKDDPEQPRFIQTVTGKGYRFIAPVADLPSDGSQAEAANLAEEKEPGAETPVLHPTDKDLSVGTPVHTQGHRGPEILRASRWPLVGLAAALVIVVALGVAFVLSKSRPTDATPQKIRSLAVLPLKNLSGDPGQGYLADGMTEELIGRLAAIHDLRVISRTSVMQFQDPRQTVPAIAKTLGVDAIVEGSVIRDGNRIRVHAQLIQASNDEHFWSETYDREMGDVLSLESDIAQSIAEKVKATVSGQEHALLGAKRKVSPEAYESYLKGAYTNSNTTAEIERSIGFFQDAINKDPTFAPAYLGLANAYSLLGTVYAGVPPEETRPKVISAAQKALELDPELAGAHVLLAETYQRLWKWSESGAEFQRALELQPNDADAIRGLALWLICEGRTEEGVARLRRARELDPMNVEALVNDGFHLFLARHYDESIQTLRSALAVQPDIAVAHWFMGYTLIAKGQPEQAIPELEKAVELSDRSPAVIGVLVRAYAHAGRRTDALRMLDELKRRSKTGYIPAGAFINAYLGLGDNEQAFVWLERGYEEKSGIMPLLKVHPHFDPIRSDPRFAGLLRRVGLDRESSF
jgi:TolB-like protein/DNA-binding winged helix-turn-helix (wHTH) protein/Tfp pilus assembly protein PilF